MVNTRSTTKKEVNLINEKGQTSSTTPQQKKTVANVFMTTNKKLDPLNAKTILSVNVLQKVSQENLKDVDDSESIKGRFGWGKIGYHYLPYLMRIIDGNNLKFISARIVESHLLNIYLPHLHPDVYSFTLVRSYFMTKSEAELLNEINKQQSYICYGKKLFVAGKDVIVNWDELNEFYMYISLCFKKLNDKFTPECQEKCGFIRINSKLILPYCLIDDKKYVPLFYFKGKTRNLTLQSIKLENWNLAYLKFCCKVLGIRQELLASKMCIVTCIDNVKSCFPPTTNFEEYWPAPQVYLKLITKSKGKYPSDSWFNKPCSVVNKATVSENKVKQPPLPPSQSAVSQSSITMGTSSDETVWSSNQMNSTVLQQNSSSGRLTQQLVPISISSTHIVSNNAVVSQNPRMTIVYNPVTNGASGSGSGASGSGSGASGSGSGASGSGSGASGSGSGASGSGSGASGSGRSGSGSGSSGSGRSGSGRGASGSGSGASGSGRSGSGRGASGSGSGASGSGRSGSGRSGSGRSGSGSGSSGSGRGASGSGSGASGSGSSGSSSGGGNATSSHVGRTAPPVYGGPAQRAQKQPSQQQQKEASDDQNKRKLPVHLKRQEQFISGGGGKKNVQVINTSQRNLLLRALPVPVCEEIDLTSDSPPSSPGPYSGSVGPSSSSAGPSSSSAGPSMVPQAPQRSVVTPWPLKKIAERHWSFKSSNAVAYKIQNVILNNKKLHCINADAFMYSDLMILLNDLVLALFPKVTVVECAQVLSNYLNITLYSGNSDQISVLLKNRRIKSNVAEKAPLVMLEDINRVWLEFVCLMNKFGKQPAPRARGRPRKRPRTD